MARNKKTSETLFQFTNLLITLLAKNGQHRTMQHYKATLNSFKRYRANRDIALRDLSAEEMRSRKFCYIFLEYLRKFRTLMPAAVIFIVLPLIIQPPNKRCSGNR